VAARAVHQGDGEGVGAEEGAQAFRCFGHLPGLDGDEDGVGWAELGGVVRGTHGVQGEITCDAGDLEPTFADRPEVVAAGEEGDILTGFCEVAAEIGADATLVTRQAFEKTDASRGKSR
jgi:hypothetical protein